MASQTASPWTIERLTGADSRTVLRPVFEEYLTWVAEQLRDNYGIVFEESNEVVRERHHRAFDAELPKMLGPRGRVIVARAGDAIVGVGTMKPVTDDIAEIKRVYVRPGARGQGIARAIMARLLDDARTERFAMVRLETMDFMRQAIALYRSIGATETAQFDESEAAAAGVEGFTRYLQIRLPPG
jgi:ribosomal protein S18 acetylase RimI-like enzyme